MERKIVVYGNGDKRPYPVGFPTEALFQRWIVEDIFALYSGRYHYTQGKEANTIVLSRGGLACGHFEIEIDGKEGRRQRHMGVGRQRALGGFNRCARRG